LDPDGGRSGLDARESLWVDIHEVRKQTGHRTRLNAEHDDGNTLKALQRIEGLLRGDFLSGFFLRDAIGFESWQMSVEESLRREHAGILEGLATAHMRGHAYEEAIECALRWLQLDPVDEAGHRILMISYALAGKRGEALRRYERCRDLFAAELGTAPDAQTEELRAQIAGGGIHPDSHSAPPGPDTALPPGNLRASPTAFIGREPKLKAVTETLLRPDVRLLTITGPAGTGKTRLALKAARRVVRAFPHGAFFVDLAPLRDPIHVVPTVAPMLGARGVKGINSSPLDIVCQFLRRRNLLLVMDNFEHLLDRAAGAWWTRLLEQEYDNLRAAVAWSTEHDVETALRTAGALERFCDTQGHWRDECDWLEKALSRSQGAAGAGLDRWRAKALGALCSSSASSTTGSCRTFARLCAKSRRVFSRGGAPSPSLRYWKSRSRPDGRLLR
jgi:tetratricopeptide (TPR) repeat protein